MGNKKRSCEDKLTNNKQKGLRVEDCDCRHEHERARLADFRIASLLSCSPGNHGSFTRTISPRSAGTIW
jgi:hypothetical protein